MTCGDKFNKNCPTGGTRVGPEEVAGRPVCIHPDCGQPLLGTGKCPQGHSQHPATLARAIAAEVGPQVVYRALAGEFGPQTTAERLLVPLTRAATALQVAALAEDQPELTAELQAMFPEEVSRLLRQAVERGPVRLTDLPGREHVKRALEVAAAGDHEICLQGHPEVTAPFAAWAKAQGIRVQEAAPCRCGNYGDPHHECTCRTAEVARWRQRKTYRRAQAAPIIVQVDRPSAREEARRGEPGSHVLARAVLARNAPATPLVPDEMGLALLRAANAQLNLGWVRSMRVIEVARSIARLDGSGSRVAQIAEAIQYQPRTAEYHNHAAEARAPRPLVFRNALGEPRAARLEDIPGQEKVKAALERALVGGHTVGVLAGGVAADIQPLLDWGRAHGIAVSAVALCPCGYYGSPDKECTCSVQMIARHRARPEYQAALRSDIVVAVTEGVPFYEFEADLRGKRPPRATEPQVLERVAAAQAVGGGQPQLALTAAARQLVDSLGQHGLSAAESETLQRLAGTEARLAGETTVDRPHLLGAWEFMKAAHDFGNQPGV